MAPRRQLLRGEARDASRAKEATGAGGTGASGAAAARGTVASHPVPGENLAPSI